MTHPATSVHQRSNHIPTDWKERFENQLPPPLPPPWWAKGGHAQTLLGHFIPWSIPVTQYQSGTLQLEDGDRLAFRYHKGTRPVVVYLFHGLGGSTDSDYIRASMAQAAGAGCHVYAVNHRGQGEGAGLAAGLYHSGSANDLGAVIAYGRSQHPDHLHLAVGYSLSGNALLLLMAACSHHPPPDGALAVNAPIDLAKSALALTRGFSRLYDLRFVRRCTAAVNQRFTDGLIPKPYRVPVFATLRDFDDLVTAPMGGFRNREHYYESCSAMPHLHRIRNPTLIVTSKDDPMVDYGDYLRADLAPAAHLQLEDRGGHMGYLTQAPGGRRLPALLTAWLQALAPTPEQGFETNSVEKNGRH